MGYWDNRKIMYETLDSKCRAELDMRNYLKKSHRFAIATILAGISVIALSNAALEAVQIVADATV